MASIGKKDKPIYLRRDRSYVGLLDWVSVQPVVFYDVDDRRAWLVDGASALLHLLRASIDRDRMKPVYRSRWKFNGMLEGLSSAWRQDRCYQGLGEFRQPQPQTLPR